MRTAVPQ